MTASLEPYGRADLAGKQSIHETLNDFYRRMFDRRNRPRPWARRRRFHVEPERWDRLYSFAFVRNPWDRAFSIYSFYKRMNYKWFAHTASFEHFLEELAGGAFHFQSIHGIRPQIEYICDYRREVIVDFVGRFETLESDFAQIAERIGIENRLGHLNRSTAGDYREHYDERSRKLVEQVYGEDAERFGYSF